jgi:hypothetical protein
MAKNIAKFFARNKWRYMRGAGYTGSALAIFNTVMLVRLTFNLNLNLIYMVVFGIGLAFGIISFTWLLGYMDVNSKMVAYEQDYITRELNPFFIEMDGKLNKLIEESEKKKERSSKMAEDFGIG